MIESCGSLNHSNTRLVVEGLLAHFFSSSRPDYHHNDVLWFLKLANESAGEALLQPLPIESGKSADMPVAGMLNKLEQPKVSVLKYHMYVYKVMLSLCSCLVV